MADIQYELRYLPLFYEDLEQKVIYISQTLPDEKAANDLLDAVEKAIMERLPIAESFEPYRSLKEKTRTNLQYNISSKYGQSCVAFSSMRPSPSQDV